MLNTKTILGAAVALLIYTATDWFIRYQLDKRFPLPNR
jgi:hypothetical protein